VKYIRKTLKQKVAILREDKKTPPRAPNSDPITDRLVLYQLKSP
jgi:hypothetical protein